MSDQPLGGFKRASDFSAPCVTACKHDTDIAVMKERDLTMGETLKKILQCSEETVKELGRITLLESQLISHHEDIATLTKSVNELVAELRTVEKRVTAWENQFKGGWRVITILSFVAVGLLGYVWNDIKGKYGDLDNRVTSLNVSIDQINENLTKLKFAFEAKVHK